VGVVEDAARNGYQDAPFMSYYLPATQVGRTYNAIYVRTGADAGAALTNVASLLQSFSAQVRYAQVRTMDKILDPQARAWKLGATMFSAFGLLALCLAAIGLYSVLAFDVAQRTRELGIRTALGARKPELLKSVVLQGVRLSAAGVLMGLAVAWMGAPFLEELLFQVSPRDPEVLGGVTVLLLAVTGLASLVPALRATRVDPMEAMRAE
jgi:ABC-type antimicrobial peptide transport system permease subunit